MADGKSFLKQIAPTLASFIFGPAAGVVVDLAGKALGLEEATVDDIRDTVRKGNLTGDQIAALRQAEIAAQAKEKELGIRADEIAAADRDSARKANVAGNVQNKLFILSLLLLTTALGCEVWVLFKGYPSEIPDIIVGRVLGLMDSVATLVLAYWFGTTAGSAMKTDLLAQSTPVK